MKLFRLLKISSFLLAAIVAVSLWLPFSATLLSLVCVFVAGWYIASKAEKSKLTYAVLVPVFPSVVLQLWYLLDRAVYYPDWMNLLFFVVNLGVACLVGLLGGLVPYLRDKNRRRVEAKHIATVTRGRSSIERLFAVLVLAAFSTQLLVSTLLVPVAIALLPSLSPVHAETRQTVNEFFDSYDPEKDYQPATEPIVPPLPPGSVPVSQMSAEQREEYCLEYGYAAKDPACSYEFEYYEGSPVQQPWYVRDSMMGQMFWNSKNGAAQKNISQGKQQAGVSSSSKATLQGKIASSSKQKGFLYHAGQFGKGIFDTGASLVVGLAKATVSAGKWIVQNPKQAVNGAKQIASFLNPVTAPQAFYKAGKYVYDNRSSIAQTAIAIKQAGDRYGWNNVVSAALFSPEAVQAFKNQEYGYAIGRGLSEFALNIVTLIPPLAAAKVPVVGKQLATVVTYVNKVDDLISGIQLVKAVAKPAAEVFSKIPKAMGVADFAESTIATAVRNPDIVEVVQKTVTVTEKQLPDQSVLQKGFNQLFDTRPAPVEVASVNPQKVQQTTQALAQMYTEGKSYDTAFSTLNHTLETGRTKPEAAARVLDTIAEYKGVQHLLADSADPVVAQTITRKLAESSTSVPELSTIGTMLQKQDLTPVAVRTHTDGTTEILTRSPASGEYTVHYPSADGSYLSKPYVPKEEDGFVGQQLYAQADKVAYNRVDTGADASKTNTILDPPKTSQKLDAAPSSPEISGGGTGSSIPSSPGNYNISPASIPAHPQKAAEAGSLPRPSATMYITYEQLQTIEHANRRFIVDPAGKAKIQGAHGIEKHVEKDADYLEFRTDPAGENIDQASTFISKEVYEKEVNRVLQENWQEIELWLKSDKPRDIFRGTPSSDPVGIVLERNPKQEKIAFVVDRIVLQKDGRGGYYILTNYIF